MIAFHLLATVALTLLFTVGERALWRTIERLVPRWSLPVLPAPFRAPVRPSSGSPRPGSPTAASASALLRSREPDPPRRPRLARGSCHLPSFPFPSGHGLCVVPATKSPFR